VLLAGCRRTSDVTPDADARADASTGAGGPGATVGAPTGGGDPAALAAFGLPPDRFSEQGMLAEATFYLDRPAFRRAALVASLSNPRNTYSRQRLDAYALETRGWDLLPAWNPQSLPVTAAMAAEHRAHRPLVVDPASARLWDGQRPTTMAGWVALGRAVFMGYPLRVENVLGYALEHPEVAARAGVRPDADGVYPGLRLFTTIDGKPALGITCALCHASIDAGGTVTVGEARRSFDYGALRLAYHEATGTHVDAELARRMRTWGPGRADVTEDDDEDPVAVPDLWGLRHQTVLTQAGTLDHAGPTVLAIRQETQILHSNHQKVRPPRELAYALAMFLYSLSPPKPQEAAGGEASAVTRGQALFRGHCKKCHSNEAFGGPPVSAERIGTDRSLAFGGARGTGKYRPPALLRVAAAAPYFHHGAVPTLDDVLSPERLEPSYAKGSLGKGAVPGHVYGTDLPREDRSALVAYLRTL